MSDQTPWPDPRYQRPAPPPYSHGRHPVPPPVYGPPVTAVPYPAPRRRVNPLLVIGLVLGGFALLCCGAGTVGALVDGGDTKGSTALPVAEQSADPADVADATEPALTTEPVPPATTAAPPTTAPPATSAPPARSTPPTTARPRVTTSPPAPRRTTTGPRTTTKPASGCDPSYPGVCIPPAPPDLNCDDITYRRFTVRQPDPHGFDRDKNGVGCESG